MAYTLDESALVIMGKVFLEALAVRDFGALQACFAPTVKLRALLPSSLREGYTAAEATAWFQAWFGKADPFRVLSMSADPMADRVHLAFRAQGYEDARWFVVEQQAYCTIYGGRIAEINLICSGFRTDPTLQMANTPTSASGSETDYDTGTRGCADGPLDEIGELMRGMSPGQQLRVRAADPSVAHDLPAWCRLVGYACEAAGPEQFLITRR